MKTNKSTQLIRNSLISIKSKLFNKRYLDIKQLNKLKKHGVKPCFHIKLNNKKSKFIKKILENE
jgi:hypothetical protein